MTTTRFPSKRLKAKPVRQASPEEKAKPIEDTLGQDQAPETKSKKRAPGKGRNQSARPLVPATTLTVGDRFVIPQTSGFWKVLRLEEEGRLVAIRQGGQGHELAIRGDRQVRRLR